MGKIVAAVAAGFGAIIIAAGPAGAATITLTPSTVVAGHSVTVSGNCAPDLNTSGEAISPAFLHDASHDFAGVGAAFFQTNPTTGAFSVAALVPATTAPGSYNVSVRCGGGLLGAATLTVTGAAATTAATTPALASTGRKLWPLSAAGVTLLGLGFGLVLLVRPARGLHFNRATFRR
jgi:hypothetical protein